MVIAFILLQATPLPPPPTTNIKPSALIPAQKQGRIIMYRTKGITGAISSCPIRYRGHEVVNLMRGNMAIWTVPSGRYILSNKVSSVEVNVAPDETRYVRCQIATGQGFAIQVVEQDSFDKRKSELKEKLINVMTGPDE